MRRLFPSPSAIGEFLVFLGVGVAGMVQATLVWVAVAALALFLLSWSRWQPLIAKPGAVDANYRDLARDTRRAREAHRQKLNDVREVGRGDTQPVR
jgi:hypothetical protein